MLGRIAMATIVLSIWAPLALRAQSGDADVRVSTSIEAQTAFVGEALVLRIDVENANEAEIPERVEVEGLQIEYRGSFDRSSSVTTIINGRRTQTRTLGVTYEYRVVATEPGEYAVPPIEVIVDGQRFTSGRVPLRIEPPREDRDVRLFIEVDNEAPYVGEPVTLRVTLALSTRLFEAKNVGFSFPMVKGPFRVLPSTGHVGRADQISIPLLGEPVTWVKGQSILEGEAFDTFSAEVQIVPRRAGVLEIGPATASMDLQLERPRSIFDRPRMRRAVVPSNELAVRARPLPSEGRPEGFTGLVGRYSLRAEASPTEVNVGDPISLPATVRGTTPSLAPEDLGLETQPGITGRFRVGRQESAPRIVGNSKVYERVLRAISEDAGPIPPIELGYFNVETGRYETASTEPIDLTIRPTKVVTAADAIGGAGDGAVARSDVQDVTGGIRHNFGASRALVDQSFRFSTVARSPLGVTALAGPPAAWATVGIIALWRRKSASDSSVRRRRTALARARRALQESGDDPAKAAGAAREYVADVFDRPAEALTNDECVALLAERLDEELTSRIGRTMRALESASYGGAASPDARESVRGLAEALVQADRRLRRGGAR